MRTRSTMRTAAIAAVAIAATVLAGCSAGRQVTPPAGSSGAAAPAGSSAASSGSPSTKISLVTDTPAPTKEIDKITWNVFEGEPQTIDPFMSADYTPNMINSNMCENLLAQNPDFSISPNLAESFSNPDPLHWVYNLRTDVKFWDGSPMTAEDVAFSLNHNLTDNTTFYNYLFSNVKSIDVTGDHQVTVTLSKPDYMFNDEMADYAGVVVEKKFFEEHPKDFGSPNVGVMCTGPFEFKSWTKGQSITVTKNPDYWNKKLEPKVDTIEFTFLTDSSSITSGLLSGQIDGTYEVPPSGIPQLQSSSAGTLYYGPSLMNMTMVYANPKGPMANLKLREALQEAVNWQGVLTATYHDSGTLLKSSIPPAAFDESVKGPLQEGYDALPDPQSGNIDDAKKLVAEAGADASKTITMVVPAQTETQQFGLAVESAAKSIGLKFTLKVVPSDVYTNYLYDPQTRAGVDILYTLFWPNVPTAMDYMGITAVSGGSFNQYGYSGIDDLYDQARSEADPAARAKILVEIQKKLRDDLLPMVPGLGLYNTLWLGSKITGAPASFDFTYYPWAAYLGGK